MKAVAVILAAGEARSMGHPKAVIEHEGGRSFLQSLASTFAKAGCQVVGVIGQGAEAVREQHPTLALVESVRWKDGLLESVKVGLEEALSQGAEVVLLHPVDMPALRASTLKALLPALREGEDGLRPEFEGAPGQPVVLWRSAAERLLGMEGGQAQLEAALGSMRLRRVPVKDPGVLVNINTPETYERLFGIPPRPAPPPKRRMRKEAGAAAAVAPPEEEATGRQVS